MRCAREDKEIVEATLARTREDSARRADAAATETETLRRELEKVLDALEPLTRASLGFEAREEFSCR